MNWGSTTLIVKERKSEMKASTRTFYQYIVILLMFAIFLSSAGCVANPNVPPEGAVYAIQNGTTLWVIKESIAGARDTRVFMKEDMYMFFKSAGGGGWYSVGIDTARNEFIQNLASAGIKGQSMNANDVSKLVEYMKKGGWKEVGSGSIPMMIRAAVDVASSWLTLASASMPTFLILPAGIPLPPDLQDKVVG